MNLQTFQEVLAKRPFQPFKLVMSSGETYEVRHPEMAMLTRRDILIGLDETKDGVPASFKIGSLLQITAIEPVTSKYNGSSSRKRPPSRGS